jgi:alpha-tubulin suppressor-like RCC1 family protein
VRCWQLISSDETAVGLGPAFPAINGALDIVQGTLHGCALMPDGNVQCWGDNEHGQVGVGSTGFSIVQPTAVALDRVTRIAVGGYHTCALRDDNRAYCWGYGFYGEVGDGIFDNHPTPTAIDFGH